jgi:hypothetical protein
MSTKTRLGLDPNTFAQELRKAHCAHANAGEEHHVCIGTCVIDRDGVQLTCEACGSGDHPLAPQKPEIEPARSVLEAAGISWSSLTPEAQWAAVNAARRGK